MTARITYASVDGTDSIERDEWHNDVDGFVTAYDNTDGRGVSHKVSIPTDRVITVEEE